MPKTLKKLIPLILFTQILFCVFLLSPTATNADSYKFKIPIPGFESVNLDDSTKPLAQYIEAIYKYAIGVVAILATIVMMIGGVVWITAAGDSGRIGEAKQYITGALTGLVLALCSFMILQTVDPDLVRFKAIGIEPVKNITKGCCELTDARPFMSTQDFCENGDKEARGVWFSGLYYPGETRCIKYSTNGNECENTECAPGLECIATGTLFNSKKLCTNGAENSPCNNPSDCSCSTVALCNNYKCVCVKKL